jgi:hypothetical protein
LTAPRERWYALGLIVPGVWYAFGPPGGFYSVLTVLPGFRNVRAPIQMWFVAALGLALLAGAGMGVLRRRVRSPWLVVALFVVTGADLYHRNMSKNRLAYARESFQDLYGAPQDRFRMATAPFTARPMARIYSSVDSPAFGPLNGALDTRTEVTFGYNPLELTRYRRYLDAVPANPSLLNSLAVTAALNPGGVFVANPGVLPRIYAPASVAAVRTADEAAARLATLHPSDECVVEGMPAIPRNGGVEVQITGYEGDLYRARYTSDHQALLRVAVPYFPGWEAQVDGRTMQIAPVDLALTGVMVPQGSHELVMRYRPTRFATGAAISAVSWALALAALVLAFRVRTEPRPADPLPK